jgi:hypothetical protein
LINNRQGGRRRGRGSSGGGRIPNNAPSGGNRQDNRQRGNAAQLLEKYRQLARDAQLGGDRVQTETYHQYADHYFRVLNENRPRFDEQRRPNGDDFSEDYEGDEDAVSADGEGDDQEQGQGRSQNDDYDQGRGNNGNNRPPRREYQDNRGSREPREAREPRDVREPREPRPFREPREAREGREPRPQSQAQPQAEAEQRNAEPRSDEGEPRRRRPRREMNGDGAGNGGDDSRIALDSLPPAISATVTVPGDDDGEDSPRPRRRTRRPRADEAGDATPAAA